ncbi:hypothetical protein ACI77O_12745 [Pseudomonas tritici]|uniref:hypothetical protein n=1 Tax=Pseudomonas tritici TaxID=2745518 RepID=UPI00387ACF4C
MQAKKPELEVINEIIVKLAAEGVEAFVEQRESEYEEGKTDPFLRVPAWENEKHEGTLCRSAVYAFIHGKLDGQPGKSFMASSPTGPSVEVYSYNPTCTDEGKELGQWNILIWGVGASLDKFDWVESIEGDDSAWWDGWDMATEFDYLEKRVANLWMLLNYTIIDTPAVPPLTPEELTDVLKDTAKSDALICHAPDLNDRWTLRLGSDDQLVVHVQSSGALIPITDTNFDKGRLVLDGHVLMHRCWGL